MNAFVQKVKENNLNAKTTTENGMKSRRSTGSLHLDLFNRIGAARGSNVLPHFLEAFEDSYTHPKSESVDSKELALRIVAWSRDIRGGAGERQIFKDILSYLEKYHPTSAKSLIRLVPEIGRWDDILLDYSNKEVESYVVELFCANIKNGLCAKWSPRKGKWASLIRTKLGLTAKQFRKLVVANSNTVEQKMSTKEWGSINYSHVPSKASLIYKSAFRRNDEERYLEFLASLQKGSAKVNAGAVYPHEVYKACQLVDDKRLMNAQWDALPNYMNNKNILPMVDISGSMSSLIGSGNYTAMDISVALGLYCSSKNTGVYKDLILSFTSEPFLFKVSGSTLDKRISSFWKATRTVGYSTNIMAAFEAVLKTAVKSKAPKEDMPEYILILSDMQFNSVHIDGHNTSLMKALKQKYKEAGYDLPKIVFWNLKDGVGNIHVKSSYENVALVSGFSPSILKSVLGNIEDYTPMNVMFDAIMSPRYSIT